MKSSSFGELTKEYFDHLIRCSFQAIKYPSCKRKIASIWDSFSIFQKKPAESSPSIQKLEQIVDQQRKDEDKEGECVECKNFVFKPETLSKSKNEQDSLVNLKFNLDSKTTDHLLMGHFEITGEKALTSNSNRKQIKRSKIPIEIEERFFHNYFSEQKVKKKVSYQDMSKVQVRTKSDQILKLQIRKNKFLKPNN